MDVLLYGAGAAAITRFEVAILMCIDANAERDLHAQADKYPAEKCAKKRCLRRNGAKFVEDCQRRLDRLSEPSSLESVRPRECELASGCTSSLSDSRDIAQSYEQAQTHAGAAGDDPKVRRRRTPPRHPDHQGPGGADHRQTGEAATKRFLLYLE